MIISSLSGTTKERLGHVTVAKQLGYHFTVCRGKNCEVQPDLNSFLSAIADGDLHVVENHLAKARHPATFQNSSSVPWYPSTTAVHEVLASTHHRLG
mmetsp:Transcript_4839/g.9581  ORF Transcript_4839/g.9581 Transcript_4839/m.9581 type:complete len:97 (+) Transcript_4839:79-369(+)